MLICCEVKRNPLKTTLRPDLSLAVPPRCDTSFEGQKNNMFLPLLMKISSKKKSNLDKANTVRPYSSEASLLLLEDTVLQSLLDELCIVTVNPRSL